MTTKTALERVEVVRDRLQYAHRRSCAQVRGTGDCDCGLDGDREAFEEIVRGTTEANCPDCGCYLLARDFPEMEDLRATLAVANRVISGMRARRDKSRVGLEDYAYRADEEIHALQERIKELDSTIETLEAR